MRARLRVVGIVHVPHAGTPAAAIHSVRRMMFELGVYEPLLLIGGAVILVGSVALPVGSVREDIRGFRMLCCRRAGPPQSDRRGRMSG